MSASPSEWQPPTPGSYNNPIVLEDSAPSPWQDDVVPAPRLQQKKPRKERSDKGKHRIKSGDMGKSGQDELESHSNRPKSVNSSAASQQRNAFVRAMFSKGCVSAWTQQKVRVESLQLLQCSCLTQPAAAAAGGVFGVLESSKICQFICSLATTQTSPW